MEGAAERVPAILAGDDAPIWSRDYSDGEPSENACQMLGQVLSELGAKRMVVGHTVQKSGISAGRAEAPCRRDPCPQCTPAAPRPPD